MTDTTLDVLLDAVRELAEIAEALCWDDMGLLSKSKRIKSKLDALIAQRRGRPDDQATKGAPE